MRTFLLLMSFVLLSFSPTNSVGQVKVMIESSKTRTIDEVFDLIKKQTNYHFVYEQDLNQKLPLVLIPKGKLTVDELLKKVLDNTNYEHLQSGKNTILIKKREIPAQKITVMGKVTDKSGMPLPGVTVHIKGKATGTTTDFDGIYKLEVSSGQDVIVFSYVGFKTIEVKVNSQKVINQTLLEDVTELDALQIVSTGYQNISKERATGSFQKINEEVLDFKISQDIISKIEGEVSGVLFDNTDGVTIRGLSTINANDEPLIIVDGFPVSQDLNSINPNDVKSISILKDAAAASIWGIRAANGVIVIVTKKGSNKETPTVSLSSITKITSRYDLNDLKYAPTSSYLQFEKHRADNKWINYPTNYSAPRLSKGIDTYLKLNNKTITQSQADGIINGLLTKDNRNEFEDLFMANTIWSQHNASISGGGTHNTYRASLTYNKNESLNFFKNNDRDEIIINLNNSINLSKKWQLNLNFNFNTYGYKNNGLSFSDYSNLSQYQDILGSNGEYLPQRYGFYNATTASNYPYSWDYNLKQEYDNKNNDTKTTLIRLQSELKYDITDYLNIQGKYQYEWGQNTMNNLFNENTFYVRNLVNIYTAYNTAQAKYVSTIPKGSVLANQFGQNKTHSGRFQLNLDKSFNDREHNITSVAGYEIRQETSNSFGTSKFGYDPESLTYANIPFGTIVNISPSGTGTFNDPTTITEIENRFISYFGNAAYSFKRKYILSGSIRLDDANLFGGNREYRNIPLYSVGLKWNLHEEPFMKSIKNINLLSLRGTYGSNGNVDNSTSPFLQAGLSRDSQTNNQYAFVSTVKNPSLRLEKTFVQNLGLDFGFFDNRLSGNIEYYYKKSIDLLSTVSISSTLGFNSALINAGVMTNKGVDMQLTGRIINNKKFKYETTLNFSYNKNEVTNVDVPTQTINTYLDGEPLEGKPLRYLFSYDYIGLDSNGYPLTLNQNGDVIDVNGRNEQGVSDLITDVNALVYNGSLTPKYYGGWINNFNYKNFNLRILTTYKFDYVFRNRNVFDYYDVRYTLNSGHIHQDYDKRWQNPGDENNTTIPRLPALANDLAKPGYNYYANANQFIDDASHIRLKQIALGYNLNSTALKAIGIQQFELGFQADNLAIFTFNKWNVDPESMYYKTPASYTFNIKANF
ncbi:SusC/RagA family TonB-linked outer membrane protein [Flavobacterium pectinovorum]|uniref:SusC/RagA family TonB-linked outer membrane protein n=1 Tax=Flavobacterium pectinovorum TaxID=29533 RepID=UPI001FAD6BA6|nr:SusC/RagA family TonB-linked outer membrane protein [Flavobacterium pectinovorum]MCI9845770.1 SusC/RagA family TonB-linked outer membrane protein [Flavobacterium pectinovorum]